MAIAGHAPSESELPPWLLGPRLHAWQGGWEVGQSCLQAEALSLPTGAEGPEKPSIKSGLKSGPGHIWGPLLGLLLLPLLVLAGIF